MIIWLKQRVYRHLPNVTKYVLCYIRYLRQISRFITDSSDGIDRKIESPTDKGITGFLSESNYYNFINNKKYY